MAHGVKVQFFSSDKQYTYLIGPECSQVGIGDHVVVYTPSGEFKVVRVMSLASDLALVPMLKHIVCRIDTKRYFELAKKRERKH